MEFSPKQQTTELIKKANKILIVGRTDFDVDTIGSMLALVSVLKSLEKEVTAVVSGEISEGYNFLPEITKLEKDIAGSKDTILKVNIEENPVNKLSYNVEEGHLNIIVTAKNKAYKDTDFIFEKGNYEYDLIIVLDTGDVDKIDKIYDKNTELFFEKPVINIDHHAGNEYFGTVNLVDITATSTAEILISIIEALGQNLLTEDVATNLLAGLIYDTGSFKNKNTTPKSLTVAAQLLAAGARQQEIIDSLYKAKSLTTLKLWGKILSSLTFEEKVRFVWSKVNFEEFKTSGLNVSEVENMIDELIGNTPGADVFLLLLETEKGKVLGKLRGQRGFDVLKIAEMFGGKGQFHSAEFELMNQEFAKATEEISSKILNYLKKTLGVETENTKRVVIPLQKLDKERLYESKEVKPIAEETSEHIETQIPEAVIGTAEREAKETTSDVAKPVEEKEKEAIDEIKDIINNEDSVSFEAPEVTDAISKAIESLEKESAKLDEIQKEAKNKGDMTPLRDVLKNKEIGGKKIDDSVFYDNKGDMTAPSETEITHKDPDIDTDDEVRVWTEN